MSIEIPDLLWEKLLRIYSSARFGLIADIMVGNGVVIEKLVISNKGRVLGRLIDQMPQNDGIIDESALTFTEKDIRAIRVSKKTLFGHRKWVGLVNG